MLVSVTHQRQRTEFVAMSTIASPDFTAECVAAFEVAAGTSNNIVRRTCEGGLHEQLSAAASIASVSTTRTHSYYPPPMQNGQEQTKGGATSFVPLMLAGIFGMAIGGAGVMLKGKLHHQTGYAITREHSDSETIDSRQSVSE